MIIETFMASEPAARSGGDRWMVGVNVDAEVLIDDDPEGVCELDDGPALPAETVRRLFCDASTVAIIRRQHGEPLTVSRRSRTLPAGHAERRGSATRDAASRAAANASSSTSTTSTTKAVAVVTRSPTSSSSVGSTTASCTRAVGPSASSNTTKSSPSRPRAT